MVVSKQRSDEELANKYQKEVLTLKGIFENWTDLDLIALLDEVNGDITLAASRISEGIIYFNKRSS